jgi:hypothetical protein
MKNIYVVVVGVDGFGNDIQVCEDFGYFTDEEKVVDFVKELILDSVQSGIVDIENFSKPEYDENNDEIFYTFEETNEFIKDMLDRDEPPFNIYGYMEIEPN